MSAVITKAVSWAVGIAQDDSHGYSQYKRWGPDYDCSSLVISAYEQAGVPVKEAGATYTGNMRRAFEQCGFKSIKYGFGTVLMKGDVLLNEKHHAALYIGDGQIVQASIAETGKIYGKEGDQTTSEIEFRNFYVYRYGWDYILRYGEKESEVKPFNEEGVGEFVERLYQTTLGRPSDPAGKAYWIDKARSGATGADLAYGFWRSPELLRLSIDMTDEEYVETLYQAFFGRHSDPIGLDYWCGRLEAGYDRDSIIEGFIGSVEWRDLCRTYGISPK